MRSKFLAKFSWVTIADTLNVKAENVLESRPNGALLRVPISVKVILSKYEIVKGETNLTYLTPEHIFCDT